MQLHFRPANLQWGQWVGWAARSYTREWADFVGWATPRQLRALGFLPPGHDYRTPETLAGMASRYPDLDLAPWPPSR